jgi:hypothetical protein
MFKKLMKKFDIDVTLVVYSEDPIKTQSLIESIDYHESKVETQFNGDNAIIVIEMKYSEYRKFMDRLQSRGRNLKQREISGLIDDLI